MFYFSYRSRQRLRTWAFGIGIGLLIIIGLLVGAFFYLERYIVYTTDGAKLVFPDKAAVVENPTFTVQPELQEMPPIVMEGDVEPEVIAMTQLRGYYISSQNLTQDLTNAIPQTGEQIAVMVDMASIYGNYFFTNPAANGNYSTAVSLTSTDSFLQSLAQREDIYLIAALPAFANSAQALANQNDGLALSGGALWMDADGAYWMDPAKDSTVSHLITAAYGAMSLGFDEIVYTDFYFPESSNIAWEGDKTQIILDVADQLSTHSVSSDIAISFASEDSALLPYTQRLYLSSGNTALLSALEEAMPPEKSANETLVFVTTSRDTRFEPYGILVPWEDGG